MLTRDRVARAFAVLRRAAIAATLCGGSACTLVIGLDGLATGGGTGGTSDADTGSPPLDSGISDAGTGSPQADAGVSDVTSPPWCASIDPVPRACLDFDTIALGALDTYLENGWLAYEAAGSSAPNALLAMVADDRQGHAFVRMRLGDAPPSHVAWSFDVRLERGNRVDFCELRLNYSDGFCAIVPLLEANDLWVDEYCSGTAGVMEVDHKVGSVLAGTGYHRFSIVVNFDRRRTVTAHVQRPDTVVGPIEFTLADRIVPAPAELRAGVSWSPALATGTKLLVDNVTLDWQ
jgi:hypothetical protein